MDKTYSLSSLSKQQERSSKEAELFKRYLRKGEPAVVFLETAAGNGLETLALQMALAFAQGKPFAGITPVRPLRLALIFPPSALSSLQVKSKALQDTFTEEEKKDLEQRLIFFERKPFEAPNKLENTLRSILASELTANLASIEGWIGEPAQDWQAAPKAQAAADCVLVLGLSKYFSQSEQGCEFADWLRSRLEPLLSNNTSSYGLICLENIVGSSSEYHSSSQYTGALKKCEKGKEALDAAAVDKLLKPSRLFELIDWAKAALIITRGTISNPNRFKITAPENKRGKYLDRKSHPLYLEIGKLNKQEFFISPSHTQNEKE